MNTAKTRPCRVGDVLVEKVAPCGAKYTITVAAPPKHPAEGTTNDHDVRLKLAVFIPSNTYGYVIHPFRGQHVIMGLKVTEKWGRPPCGSGYRTEDHNYDGPSIPSLVAQAVAEGDKALHDLQQTYDDHKASIALQEAARNAAYAAWQVQDDT